MIIKLLYSLAIGIFLAAFIGFGLETFYKSPKYEWKESSTTESSEYKTYREQTNDYNRNATMILIGLALVIFVVSMLKLNSLEVIGEGVTLGGVFTLLYGVIRGLDSGDEIFRFSVIAVGLVLIIGMSYWKFNKQTSKPV